MNINTNEMKTPIKTPEEIESILRKTLKYSEFGISGMSYAAKLIAESYHAQFKGESMQSLIERVEGLKQNGALWNDAINWVIDILRATPCIQAKAIRKRGTNEWYYPVLVQSGREYLCTDFIETYPFDYDFDDIPPDAELVDIQILVPEL